MNAKARHRRRYRAAHARSCPGLARKAEAAQLRHEEVMNDFRTGRYGDVGVALAKAFEGGTV